MKKLNVLLVFLPMALLLMGCPVELKYPADEEGKNPIDKDLIGVWSTKKADCEIVKMEIKKRDEKSYTVTILEKGSMYMADSDVFTAWVTKIDDISILYAKGEGETEYYHYCYKKTDKNSFSTFDMSLLVGGTDAVTSTQALREEIRASSKKPDFLSSETVFAKQ